MLQSVQRISYNLAHCFNKFVFMSRMEKLLKTVFLLLFARGVFCESNPRDGCHSIVEENRLTFRNCGNADIPKIAETIRRETTVVTIDISNAGLQSIDEIDLHLNGQLKKFDASKNKLRVFPKKCLSTSPTVEEIDLSDNDLRDVDFKDFVQNNRLTSVNLSSNEIGLMALTEIMDFSALKHLKNVDLSTNPISSIHRYLFCSDCVVSLHLEHSLFSLDTQLFRIDDNISIYFSWAEIKQICLRSDSNRFHMTLDDQYEWIEAIRDKNYNYHHEIHCGEQSMKTIERLFVGENRVENLSTLLQCLGPSLQTLQLSGNFLGSLNHTVFQRFTNLEDLRIVKTELVEFDFSVISKKMRYLDLSLNNVKTVSNPSKLEEFTKLQHFDVSENHMQNTPEMIAYLHKSEELSILNLCDNYIGPVTKATFARINANIKWLMLCNTQITITDFNPFESLDQLVILDISNNNLEDVDFAVMAPTLRKLWFFLASNCHIRNVSAVFQHFGRGIMQLDLSQNSASDLSSSLFESFTRLKKLNLSHTHMPEPREMDLRLVPYSVEELYINDNGLKSITNLEGFSVPIKLDIAGNCFTSELTNQILANISEIGTLIDPFKQKSKEECAAYDRQIPNSSGDSTKIIIIVVISIATAVVVCVSFIYRQKLYGKIKSAFSAAESKDAKSVAGHSTATVDAVRWNEPIYEELDESPYVKYDELWHEFKPMPLSKENEGRYETTNNSNNTDLPVDKLES